MPEYKPKVGDTVRLTGRIHPYEIGAIGIIIPTDMPSRYWHVKMLNPPKHWSIRTLLLKPWEFVPVAISEEQDAS